MNKITIDHGWLQENGLYKCPYCNKEYKPLGINGHIWRMHTGDGKKLNSKISESLKGEKNPQYGKQLTDSHKEKIRKKLASKPGHKHTTEQKQKISNSMKLAHKEGRAWNIGINRWDNNPSYPESFFIKVIENEFNDKNYKREHVVGKFRIDFAWIDKKLAIEIDGQQHEKPEHKQRDIRKDKFLIENGWKVLRIKWIDMFNDPKKYIKISKDFIDNQG